MAMNEEIFNLSMRKFLKKVGVTSQRELEKAVYEAIERGHLKGDETFDVHVRLETDLLDEPLEIEGKLKLS